ncbi:hypothetical protein ABB37_05389 [Leptomonas pyrrhocoris]|uniref:Uncharacterized protein n=1 Tax=Leptomonas pyrrhocoris TaxID=157538 RepID=A0A0M9G079_LEPPY|nr:hypothetical protein ABB37_05389 [Leptomonas pyrrhocoris]XP_015658022.1 hypothetical protein ABB37_05389 [Leptomonas pyrrhocoris]KPA79582.1 hypothetical protein ABB37_05389 [Leptomonas pyrrhocoris]KPA79583.1 hypothetical protein ABB37_05389 [Leptomonas pyrrhocoris]|eukprot:XP_015658021.1 hypothetical protein ABB37_05389 [Leptomonas pyrrhocoris]
MDALLAWCGEHVCAYAGAVREVVQQDGLCGGCESGALSSDANRAPNGDVNLGTPRHGQRTDGTCPPPTLQMAGRQTAARVISKGEATTKWADLKINAPSSGRCSHAGPLSPEVCESVIAAVTALLELAGVFAQMVAKLVLSSNTGVVEASHDLPFYSETREEGQQCESCDLETLRRGQIVRHVVDAVCDALHLLRRSPVLGDYVCHEKNAAPDSVVSNLKKRHAATSTSAATSSTTFRASDPSTARVGASFHHLCFTDAFMRHVLCCMCESWPQALQLTSQMHDWNVALQEALELPFTSTPIGEGTASAKASNDAKRGTEAATPFHNADATGEPLCTLPFETLLTLLYILAQHGRLAEVFDLCQRCLAMSAAHLLTPSPRKVNATSRFSTACDVTALPVPAPPLRFIVHLAAANADPGTAARIFSSIETTTTTTSPGDASTFEGPAACFTQATCLEEVVCAGAMPQRVLSVTEYAMLLRRIIGERLPQHRSSTNGGNDSCYGTAEKDAKRSKTHRSGSVGWWLSPSQVWRFGASCPHRVRTTLCLMGFQVSARHGFAATLSMEDLYVVLSISRQLIMRHKREAAELLDVLGKAEENNTAALEWNTGEGATGAGAFIIAVSAQRRREQRWTSWGVEECMPSFHDAVPQQPQLRQPSSVPKQGEPMSASSSSSFSNTAVEEKTRWRLLLLARRVAAPYSTRYMECLCAAFAAAQRGTLPLSSSHRTSQERSTSFSTASAASADSATTGSAVLLSLVSKEMLHLLQILRYTRQVGSYWETALRTVAAPLQACAAEHNIAATLRPTLLHSTDSTDRELRTAEQVVEEVAYALAQAAESTLTESFASTQRLVAPLPSLAPYLSAYAVGALVQRPFRRALTWEQCLALLPYTPLGSRSQLWLLRRVAQDGEGRRRALSAPVPITFASSPTRPERRKRPYHTLPPQLPPLSSPLTFPQTAVQTAQRLIEMQHNTRRLQSRLHLRESISTRRSAGETEAPCSSFPAPPSVVAATMTTPPPNTTATADGSTDADAALLTLLLESHWSRALRIFEHASSRVQAAGAPHVVRLLISADVWRDIADTQRRPLVRLAVQSSAHSSSSGASALLEEVLQTSLEHGLWHTGLYFHQCVAAEQPELVRQCRRAQVYAAQLCRGLLERTSMMRAVAQLTMAARQGQWAEAAACFMRYATGRDTSLYATGVSSDEADTADAPPRSSPAAEAFHQDVGFRKSSTSVPSTSAEELRVLTAVMNGEGRRRSSSISRRVAGEDAGVAAPHALSSPPFHSSSLSSAATASRAFSFFAESGGAVPAELAHVAQTVRYAMLRTPALWMHALRWLPVSTLPLPFSHEVAIHALCADNPAKLRALLPERAMVDTAGNAIKGKGIAAGSTPSSVPSAVVSTATATALSIVAEARRAHRPQHPNEVAKNKQAAVANALRVLQRAGAWEEATLLYDKAVASNCMPYGASTAVLAAAAIGGAPWQVTLLYFFDMAQRLRPSVAATAVALQACAEGGQWALAFRVLQQSVLTQAAPVPRLVELAVTTALHCGVWARALAAAQQYRRTRDPRLAHTILLTFVRTQHWDDAVKYFYDYTRRGLRPLDASLELAIIASEAASAEYRKTALLVGTIASALEDLFKLSGAVLEHILFVQRHVRDASSAGSHRKSSEDDGGVALYDSPEVDEVFVSRASCTETQLRHSRSEQGVPSPPVTVPCTETAPSTTCSPHKRE